MKQGRNWKYWKDYKLTDQTIIIKYRGGGDPFPLLFHDSMKEYRMPCTPIFTIKTWGTKGYK